MVKYNVLNGSALEIGVEVPVVMKNNHINSGGNTTNNSNTFTTNTNGVDPSQIQMARGSTILMNSLLPNPTSGVVQLPVRCHVAPSSNHDGSHPTVWLTLYVQYLIIRPCKHPGNNLRVVRSE